MTDSTTDDVRLQAHVEHHRRWWINAHHDKDQYDLFVVSYKVVNGEVQEQHNFALTNGTHAWVPFEEGGRVEPCLSIPGHLVHLLVDEGIPELDREAMQNNLGDLFVAIFSELLTKPEDSNARTDRAES